MQGNLQDITLPVDPKAAIAYQTASKEEQQKMQTLISTLLKQQLSDKDVPSLKEMMERMGRYAASKGLTEEKLNELLADD